MKIEYVLNEGEEQSFISSFKRQYIEENNHTRSLKCEIYILKTYGSHGQ